MTKTTQIRELAKRVAETAHGLDNWRRRGMWCAHNDMHWHGPAPVLLSLEVRSWRDILPADCRGTVDTVYRLVETQLRQKQWYAELGDDHVIEPYVDMAAVYDDDPIYMWGVEAQFSEVGDSTAFNGEVLKPCDVYKLHVPYLRMNGTLTLEQHDRAMELLDGTEMGVRMEWRNRHFVYPNFGVWVVRLIGLERFMLWCATEPDAVQHFMGVMYDTYVNHARGMQKRHRFTDNHCLIGDMFPFHGWPIEHPAMKDLWVHSDSQEFTLISPEMTDKYLLSWQRFIFGMFGLGSFGCCESLNKKLHLVKMLPNLRRVTISERTDWEYAIKELGSRFVYVVRPTLVNAFHVHDESMAHKEMEKMAMTFKGLHWEVNFPGAPGDTGKCKRWVSMAKEVVDELG